MALTEQRKALLLAYCRLDPDDLSREEHLLLEEFYASAMDYMEDPCGVSVPSAAGRLAAFDRIVNAMVLDAWETRGAQTNGFTPTENPAIRREINRLKETEPVSDLDTGTGRL